MLETLVIILGIALLASAVLGAGSFIPGPPDASLALQAEVTKTGDFSGAWLDLGESFAPNEPGVPVGAVVNVSALDLADEDKTYAFHLEQCGPDANGDPDTGEASAIGVPVDATAVGIVLAKGFVTARFVRLVLDVGGDTASITYSANLNPL